VPEFPIPLLQIFTDHSVNESIIRPVAITFTPEKQIDKLTVYELPEEAKTSLFYAVELPKTMPRESFWNQVRKLLKI
jgi:hypothetical protein